MAVNSLTEQLATLIIDFAPPLRNTVLATPLSLQSTASGRASGLSTASSGRGTKVDCMMLEAVRAKSFTTHSEFIAQGNVFYERSCLA